MDLLFGFGVESDHLLFSIPAFSWHAFRCSFLLKIMKFNWFDGMFSLIFQNNWGGYH